MKRTGRLFERIVERENLRQAVARALRGKRDRPEARQFVARLDANLDSFRQRLLAGDFRLGRFHQFVIHDPKERIITAPCFRERVLHHALMNICEPVFDRWLIDDTFACRRGRGRLAALQRARQYARRFPYFLKLDIRKYFDSVSHSVLVARLQRVFKDELVLILFTRIIDSFRGAIGRGLPIGSLTSQHFANFYLGWFDRAVKERWQIKGFVRYMDDMLLWSHDKVELQRVREQAKEFLIDDLELELKATGHLNRSQQGIDFLGCRVFPNRITLSRQSRIRFGRKLRQLERAVQHGSISETEFQVRATAVLASVRIPAVSSWKFRQDVLQRILASGHKARTG